MLSGSPRYRLTGTIPSLQYVICRRLQARHDVPLPGVCPEHSRLGPAQHPVSATHCPFHVRRVVRCLAGVYCAAVHLAPPRCVVLECDDVTLRCGALSMPACLPACLPAMKATESTSYPCSCQQPPFLDDTTGTSCDHTLTQHTRTHASPPPPTHPPTHPPPLSAASHALPRSG